MDLLKNTLLIDEDKQPLKSISDYKQALQNTTAQEIHATNW